MNQSGELTPTHITWSIGGNIIMQLDINVISFSAIQ
jgi:hypothetical protein